jgi:N-glycosylase/DNA lyase
MEHFIKTGYINLQATFNCGQCFRWKEYENNSGGISYCDGKTIAREAKDGIILQNVKESDVPYWENYFCTDEDYPMLIKRFSEDKVLKKACEFASGIRVLRQDPFETLISFIISQNNNIKRITGIIAQLCEGGEFPSASRLLELDLSEFGLGYRTRYVLDAVKKINNGEISIDEITKMDYNRARSELMKIVGVGDKVADCVLLFGFHKTEAFPKDVWIKRVMSEYYPNGLPDCIKGYEGIAQQFLFHYIRNKKENN